MDIFEADRPTVVLLCFDHVYFVVNVAQREYPDSDDVRVHYAIILFS